MKPKGKPRGAAFVEGSERASAMARRAGLKRWGRCYTCERKLDDHAPDCQVPALEAQARAEAEAEAERQEQARVAAEAERKAQIEEQVLKWKAEIDVQIPKDERRVPVTVVPPVPEPEAALVPVIDRAPTLTPSRASRLPDHATPSYDSAAYWITCPHCGVNVTCDRASSLSYVLAQHTGEILNPFSASQCRTIRRMRGTL